MIWSWFDHLFVTIERWSRRDIDMIIWINCFVTWIIFAKNARHRTRHDIRLSRVDCIIKKIVLSCCWFSNKFSLYDLIWICCTICSRLDYIYNCFLSMFMCFSWCISFKCLFLISEILFFLLVIISWKSETKTFSMFVRIFFTIFRFYVVRSIANYSRIICIFDLFLKDFDKISNDDILVWTVHVLQKDSVMTINCIIYCVLHDEKKSWNCAMCEIFCDHHFWMHKSCFILWQFSMKFI